MLGPIEQLLDNLGRLLAEEPLAFGDTGAFALNAGSADAALLTTLAPGNYTAQVTVATGATTVDMVAIAAKAPQIAPRVQTAIFAAIAGSATPLALVSMAPRTGVVLVALPEELPVTETFEPGTEAGGGDHGQADDRRRTTAHGQRGPGRKRARCSWAGCRWAFPWFVAHGLWSVIGDRLAAVGGCPRSASPPPVAAVVRGLPRRPPDRAG